MTVRYVNVKTYKNGAKRAKGGGRDCVLTGCGRSATVRATRKSDGFQMELNLCANHAQEGGVTI